MVDEESYQIDLNTEKFIKDVRTAVEAFGWLSLIILPSFFLGLHFLDASMKVQPSTFEVTYVGFIFYLVALIGVLLVLLLLSVSAMLLDRWVEITEKEDDEEEEAEEGEYKLSKKTPYEKYATLKKMMDNEDIDEEEISRIKFSDYFDVSRTYIFNTILNDLEAMYGEKDELVKRLEKLGHSAKEDTVVENETTDSCEEETDSVVSSDNSSEEQEEIIEKEARFKLSNRTLYEKYAILNGVVEDMDDLDISRTKFSEYFDVTRVHIFNNILPEIESEYGEDDPLVNRMKEIRN